MNLEFGIPTQRKKKVDAYAGQAVLIMHSLPEGSKKSRKFELSQDAAELLGYEKRGNIAVSFNGDNMFLANIYDSISEQGYNLTNHFTFSNVKLYDLDTTIDNVFTLESRSVDQDNVNALSQVMINNDIKEDNDSTETATLIEDTLKKTTEEQIKEYDSSTY